MINTSEIKYRLAFHSNQFVCVQSKDKRFDAKFMFTKFLNPFLSIVFRYVKIFLYRNDFFRVARVSKSNCVLLVWIALWFFFNIFFMLICIQMTVRNSRYRTPPPPVLFDIWNGAIRKSRKRLILSWHRIKSWNLNSLKIESIEIFCQLFSNM